MTFKAHIFGFEPEMTGMIGEALFFAGAEPVKFQDVTMFTKSFKQEPPSLIVLPIGTIAQLDLHVMLGSDERFDGVAVLAAVDDPYDPRLRDTLENCALDYFVTSQPYHLKRLALAVMSKNPWSEAPTTSGKLLLAEANLERRIGIARAMRIAQFDVSFADTTEELVKRLSGDVGTTIVVANVAIASADTFATCFGNTELKRVPWIVYGDRVILANTTEGKPDRLEPIGQEPNPDSLLFHVQDILKKPLKDLRSSKRMPMFTPVRFQVDTLRDTMLAYTRDISLNGIFVRTIAPPPPETMLTVGFRAPTGEGTVQVGARVAWRKDFGQASDPMKPAGMGIQFTRVSAPDGAAIEAGYRALETLITDQDGG
jgi:hypothetical protein